VGGHNILEPARFGKPVLFGPHMENFQNLAQEMILQGAALEVRGAQGLADTVSELLAEPQKRRSMGRRGAEIAAGNSQALGANLRLAQRYL
jgi:3-deoxy-D-manno-octulosonic-acid transferase